MYILKKQHVVVVSGNSSRRSWKHPLGVVLNPSGYTTIPEGIDRREIGEIGQEAYRWFDAGLHES